MAGPFKNKAGENYRPPLSVGKGYNADVDPRLVAIIEAAADYTGFQVELKSGMRPGDKRQHGKGNALDITLIDPATGRRLPDYQDGSNFKEYEQFAQAARAVQMDRYPDLERQFRWGGYFGTPGKERSYGAFDLMHFDLAGDRIGMAGGSWEGGLRPHMARHYGVTESKGMGANATSRKYLASLSPAGKPAPPSAPRPQVMPTMLRTPNSADEVVRDFEDFRSEPYKDNGSWRIGFGSDTITRRDGTVERVKPGMTVTREDAQRDLERRLPEFEQDLIKEVGTVAWGNLPHEARSATMSLAYNYGSVSKLPSLVSAIKSGDLNQLANEVEARGADNNGLNARRRKQEAALIRRGIAPTPAQMPQHMAALRVPGIPAQSGFEYTKAGLPIDPQNRFLMDRSDPRYGRAVAARTAGTSALPYPRIQRTASLDPSAPISSRPAPIASRRGDTAFGPPAPIGTRQGNSPLGPPMPPAAPWTITVQPELRDSRQRVASVPQGTAGSVPQGAAASVPQGTIVATEPRPERLPGRPFMPDARLRAERLANIDALGRDMAATRAARASNGSPKPTQSQMQAMRLLPTSKDVDAAMAAGGASGLLSSPSPTQAQMMAMRAVPPSSTAGGSLALDMLRGGNIRTSGGIAGTVQMPRDARPSISGGSAQPRVPAFNSRSRDSVAQRELGKGAASRAFSPSVAPASIPPLKRTIPGDSPSRDGIYDGGSRDSVSLREAGRHAAARPTYAPPRLRPPPPRPRPAPVVPPLPAAASVPPGMPRNLGSRDSVANRAAGAASVAAMNAPQVAPPRLPPGMVHNSGSRDSVERRASGMTAADMMNAPALPSAPAAPAPIPAPFRQSQVARSRQPAYSPPVRGPLPPASIPFASLPESGQLRFEHTPLGYAIGNWWDQTPVGRVGNFITGKPQAPWFGGMFDGLFGQRPQQRRQGGGSSGGLMFGGQAPRDSSGRPIAVGGTRRNNGATYSTGGGSYGSDPGQKTAGLRPGERKYDPDTNSWGLK